MPKSNKSSTSSGKKPAAAPKSSKAAAPAKSAAKPAAKAPSKPTKSAAPASSGKKPTTAPVPSKPAASGKQPPPAPAKKPTAVAAPPAKAGPAPKSAAPTAAGGKPAAKGDGKTTSGSTTGISAAHSAPAASPAAGAAATNGAKTPPKGITIVANRPMRKPKPKKLEMPASEPLLKPGGKWKPLIPSGPKAPPTGLVGQGTATVDQALLSKNKLPKKELDKYRDILLRKRAELLGDVTNMEDEALRQNSGSLSSLPQHMAEQGSDTSDQSIALDLAQVDRNLIREIDEALKRIDDGTYGVCLRTGQRISAERLAEIPWAKYSIEAQRELERRPFRE